ncbi:TPA: hypothetical protein ACF632_004424 [Salmonella enterica]
MKYIDNSFFEPTEPTEPTCFYLYMKMERKMLSAADVERQAANTAAYWMERATDEINSLFGDGYAKKHPELVAAFMNTAASDETAMSLRGIAEALEAFQVTIFKEPE